MNEQVPPEKLIRNASAPPSQDAPGLAPAQIPAPKSRKKMILALLVLGLLGGIGWYGYRYWSEGRFILATDDAYVKADVSILAAKIPGYLASVNVVENQRVKAGDILVQIDPVDYRLAVDAAQKRIDSQTATIARIQAQAEGQKSVIAQMQAQQTAAQADRIRALADYGRAESLVDKKIATPQRLDQTKADRDRTIANVAGAEAAIASARASYAVLVAQGAEAESLRDELRIALDRARRDLDFTIVRAPFDGVVGNKAAQAGAYVQPGARLMALVPLESVYIEANFKETQIGKIRQGQRAAVHVDAFADRKIEGIVASIAPASGAQFSLLPPENATGNFTKIVQRIPVRIALPKSATQLELLRPGLSVIVDIDTRTGDQSAPAGSLSENRNR